MNNGINSTFDSRKHTVDRFAERILINRNYDDGILEYDIALVKINQCDLDKCYKLSSHIQPIALPESELCQKQETENRKLKKRKRKKKKRKRKKKKGNSKKPKRNRRNKRQKESKSPWLVGRKALITG